MCDHSNAHSNWIPATEWYFRWPSAGVLVDDSCHEALVLWVGHIDAGDMHNAHARPGLARYYPEKAPRRNNGMAVRARQSAGSARRRGLKKHVRQVKGRREEMRSGLRPGTAQRIPTDNQWKSREGNALCKECRELKQQIEEKKCGCCSQVLPRENFTDKQWTLVWRTYAAVATVRSSSKLRCTKPAVRTRRSPRKTEQWTR